MARADTVKNVGMRANMIELVAQEDAVDYEL
jgi:hypothetical protein